MRSVVEAKGDLIKPIQLIIFSYNISHGGGRQFIWNAGFPFRKESEVDCTLL